MSVGLVDFVLDRGLELVDAQRDPKHVLLELSELVLLHLSLLVVCLLLKCSLACVDLLQCLTFALGALSDQLVESLVHLVRLLNCHLFVLLLRIHLHTICTQHILISHCLILQLVLLLFTLR